MKEKWHFITVHINVIKRSFIKRQTSGTSRDNERQRVVQRVKTNDNEWTTNDKECHNEWYNEWQQMATSDNE